MIGKTRLLALTAALCLLLSLNGCAFIHMKPTEPDTTDTLLADAPDLYLEAVAYLQSQENILYDLNYLHTVDDDGIIFTAQSSQSLLYRGMGTENFQGYVSETLSYGSYTTQISEVYNDGVVYSTVYGNKFSANQTPEAFLSRYPAVTLLTASLYESHLPKITDEGILMTFTDPLSAEPWLDISGGTLKNAYGTVLLDGNRITKSTYTATYSKDDVTVTCTYTQTFRDAGNILISLPSNTDAYTKITNVDAPRRLEQALGFLQQSTRLTSTIAENIYSEAAGFTMEHQTELNLYGSGVDQMFRVHQTVNQANHNAGGSGSTKITEELFRDGVYTVSTDGADPVTDSSVSHRVMESYAQGLLTDAMLDLSYIADVQCTEENGVLLLQFTCTPKLGEAYCRELNYTLFNDEAFLTNMSTAYETTTMAFYVGLDTFSGLPVSIGIHYVGKHTINKIVYELNTKVDQTFDLSCPNAYDSITKEAEQ